MHQDDHKNQDWPNKPILFFIIIISNSKFMNFTSLTSYIVIWRSQMSSGMLWSAGLHGLWSDWKPPLWSINWDKTCSTFKSLTSTLLNNCSSCFLVILIFTSVVVLAPKDPLSAKKFQSSSSSLSYLQDDWLFKQFPILQKAWECAYAKGVNERKEREERGGIKVCCVVMNETIQEKCKEG